VRAERVRATVTGIATCLGLVMLPSVSHALLAQQPLETETARLPRRGTVVVSGTYEFQTSAQGTEHAFPLALEYGLADRLALLVEPVLVTAIRPEATPTATGFGDVEITMQYLARAESRWVPALALAAEEKFPTARNRLIGTGKADFTPYLIASKRVGRVDLHANVGYSFMGKPSGLAVQNTLNVALALEDQLSSRFSLLGEVLSTTAAALAGEGEASLTAPEIAGAEQVAMVGIRYRQSAHAHTWLSLGVTYDNTRAVLFRPGVTIELP
jgi:hypothetical protein